MSHSEPLTSAKLAAAKLRLIRMHYEAGVGHIGGNLSALEALLVLYHDVLTPNDAFVLSKGHAAGALYVALWSVGILAEEELQEFHQESTRLSGHPPPNAITEIPFATGSLGHGMGLAAGLALGRRLEQKPGRVFCLTSDGEWNEGSSWETLIFAMHQHLSNFTLIVDLNGLQGFGSTKEVADLSPLAQKFKAFGAAVFEVDGHDPEALRQAMSMHVDRPVVIVASTRKGCGVSFMENRMEWHYLPLSEPQYLEAMKEIEQCETHSVRRS